MVLCESHAIVDSNTPDFGRLIKSGVTPSTDQCATDKPTDKKVRQKLNYTRRTG